MLYKDPSERLPGSCTCLLKGMCEPAAQVGWKASCQAAEMEIPHRLSTGSSHLGLRWVHRERPWASDMEAGQRPVSPRAWVEEQMPTSANTRGPWVPRGKGVRWCTGISLQLILLCIQIPTLIHSKKHSLENLFNLVLTVGFGCCGVLLLLVCF